MMTVGHLEVASAKIIGTIVEVGPQRLMIFVDTSPFIIYLLPSLKSK